MDYFLSFFLIFSLLIPYFLNGEETTLGNRPEQIRIRHIEPEGIGYNEGYTSLDLFFAIPNLKSTYQPFIDLRGHLFNSSNWAATAGTGLRYQAQSLNHVFGLNLFYDYRSTNRNHYNQLSAGLEALGPSLEFRANGYFLISEKMSSPYDFDFNLDTYELTAKREYGLSGFDTEIGYLFSEIKRIDLYISLGSYFYASQKMQQNTTGGKLKMKSTFLSYVTMEGNVSYDHLFKWVGQGILSLNFSFGGKKKIEKIFSSVEKKTFQFAERNEIIVLKKHRNNL